MKKKIVYLALIGILISCNSDTDQNIPIETNKVALLQIDYLTYAFEGGNEFEFSPASGFTISSTYQPPGDFGSVQLFYDELNEKIFDGTIIWMGTGEVSYPSTLNQPNKFPTINTPLPISNADIFHNVMYDEYSYYFDTINYTDLWNSINNLALVSNYLMTNPNGKINVFLYTPSVGVGNPAEWNWYVILKN